MSHVSYSSFCDGQLIALMMEAVSTPETSINFYETTRRNIREGCHLRFKDRRYRKFCSEILVPFTEMKTNMAITRNTLERQMCVVILQTNILVVTFWCCCCKLYFFRVLPKGNAFKACCGHRSKDRWKRTGMQRGITHIWWTISTLGTNIYCSYSPVQRNGCVRNELFSRSDLQC
jgi:hypothetical protein